VNVTTKSVGLRHGDAVEPSALRRRTTTRSPAAPHVGEGVAVALGGGGGGGGAGEVEEEEEEAEAEGEGKGEEEGDEEDVHAATRRRSRKGERRDITR
jgi:hypothetical protein